MQTYTASTDLSQRPYPSLESDDGHDIYVRVRPIPLSGVARTLTLNLCPLVNLDVDKDGWLLGIEIIDTGPYKDERD